MRFLRRTVIFFLALAGSQLFTDLLLRAIGREVMRPFFALDLDHIVFWLFASALISSLTLWLSKAKP